MRRLRSLSIGPRTRGAGRLAVLLALLSLPGRQSGGADPTYVGAGYLVGVPVPGVACTNGSGQVSIKGNVHVLRVETTDPRTTGRLQAAMDLVYQTDETTTFGGTATQEVGTWDISDPLNPRFTPTGGVWEMQYRGVGRADHSSTTTLSGYGIGGAIDGLRVEQTVTRGPGAILDPSVPYAGSGVVSTPPADIVVLDAFDTPPVPRWDQGAGGGTIEVTETGGHLAIRGNWPGIHTTSGLGTTAFASPLRPWSVKAGQTVETRADLVSLQGPGAGAVLALYSAAGEGYWLVMASNYVIMGKQLSGQVFLSAEPVTLPEANVVLTLGITPSGANVLLTARILDRGPAGPVLYEHTVLDTPAVDRSLTVAEVKTAVGLTFQDLRHDQAGPCWTSGSTPWLGVHQYTDGTLASAEATFDNFELRNYTVPQVAVERTVRLTWPESVTTGFILESAPTPSGPWLPVTLPTWPGLRQVTVPSSRDQQYWHLRETP